MPTAVEAVGENRVRLTVDVSPEQVQHAVEHAMSDLSASVKIPGFRQGKIPTQVLVSRLGKERIYAEAVDSHIGGWFWSAASRSRVRPVSDPQYEFELPATADAAWTFTATVDVQPLPELVDWTTLEVPRAEVEVPQEVVDAEIDALRESVAELAPAGDRTAQPGDTLVIDLVDAEGEAQPDTVVELGSGRLAPEIESALVGASAGETKQIEFPLTDGSTSTVEITVTEIQEKVLPEVDDELARAASEFETLEELRSEIESRLREAIQAELEADFRAGAVDKLVEKSKVDISDALVEARAAELLGAMLRSLERRGLDAETYLRVTGQTADQLRETLRGEARRAIGRELVLEAVADQLKIEVSDDEVKEMVREQAEAAEEDPDQVIEQLWETGRHERLRADLRLKKALDKIVEDVKPIPVELARARESIWTPEQEKPEQPTKLWTPGSKETA
jgi:trigger factor